MNLKQPITLTRKKTPKPFTTVPAMVNLLSPEVQQVVALRRLRHRFIVAALILVTAMAVVFFGQEGYINKANDALTAAQDKQAALAAQQKALTPIGTYYAGVEAAQTSIMQTMSKEALNADTLKRLRAAAPAAVTLNNINLTVDTTATSTGAAPAAAGFDCPTPDPFDASAAVGCITLVGTADTRATVGEFLTRLNADDRFVNAFVSSTTAGDEGISFSATVGLADTIYSKRYSDPSFLKGASK